MLGSSALQRSIASNAYQDSKILYIVMYIASASSIFVYLSFIYNNKIWLDGEFALSHIHFVVIWLSMSLFALMLCVAPKQAAMALPAFMVILACADAAVNVMISEPIMFRPVKTPAVGEREVDLTPKGLTRDFGTRLNTNLITKAPGFIAYCPLNARNSVYNHIAEDMDILNFVAGPERVWLCENPVTITPTAGDYLKLHAGAGFISKFRCVVHSEDMMFRRQTPADDDMALSLDKFDSRIINLPYKLDSYRPRVVKLSIDSPTDGYLFISDRWARSWKEEVNGEKRQFLAVASFLPR